MYIEAAEAKWSRYQLSKYESLSDKDRADVQDNAHKDAKAYLDFKKKAEEEATEQGNDTPKN